MEQIEAIAHNLILKLPADQPVVLTTVLAGADERAEQEWRRIVDTTGSTPVAVQRDERRHQDSESYRQQDPSAAR